MCKNIVPKCNTDFQLVQLSIKLAHKVMELEESELDKKNPKVAQAINIAQQWQEGFINVFCLSGKEGK